MADNFAEIGLMLIIIACLLIGVDAVASWYSAKRVERASTRLIWHALSLGRMIVASQEKCPELVRAAWDDMQRGGPREQ